MPRDAKDSIKETSTESLIVGFLQIRHYRCTQERETVAKILESKRNAITANELIKISRLPKLTVYRILKTFKKEGLIHFSASFNSYFACQSLMQSRRKISCHSFGICEKCKRVKEFIHEKHAHPKITGFKKFHPLHEWQGHCLVCAK